MKGKLSEAQRKRVRAARLLLAGKPAAEVAKAVGVARQTVYTWKRVLDESGVDGLRAALVGLAKSTSNGSMWPCAKAHTPTVLVPICGRPNGWACSSNASSASDTATCTSGGYWAAWAFPAKSPNGALWSEMTRRFETGRRSSCRGLKKSHPGAQNDCVHRRIRIERAAYLGSHVGAHRTDPGDSIQYHFNWKLVSVIAGLTRMSCLFRFHDGPIRSAQIVEFLKALHRHLRRKLLIIWDGLPAHRSRLVRDYLDSTHGAVQVAYLPPYAPDCNPVEYLWAWLKRHALANFCPDTLGELKVTARNQLKSAQRQNSIIVACWKQAELW